MTFFKCDYEGCGKEHREPEMEIHGFSFPYTSTLVIEPILHFCTVKCFLEWSKWAQGKYESADLDYDKPPVFNK